MRNQVLALSLLTSLSVASFSAFAEPPVQAGETLESLSKAKVTTTVNGQPGSLNELLASGQIKLVDDQPDATNTAQGTSSSANISEGTVDAQGQTQSVEPGAVELDANPEATQPAESTD